MGNNNNKTEILNIRELTHMTVLLHYLSSFDTDQEFRYLVEPAREKLIASVDAYTDQEFEGELEAWISEITGVPVRSQEV